MGHLGTMSTNIERNQLLSQELRAKTERENEGIEIDIISKKEKVKRGHKKKCWLYVLHARFQQISYLISVFFTREKIL